MTTLITALALLAASAMCVALSLVAGKALGAERLALWMGGRNLGRARLAVGVGAFAAGLVTLGALVGLIPANLTVSGVPLWTFAGLCASVIGVAIAGDAASVGSAVSTGQTAPVSSKRAA
ncbi:MAG: hypothetical protein IT433_06975 [Phycisphaerales bacterium]|nr:hypothetical protein [Phycisphaerales bacterium]